MGKKFMGLGGTDHFWDRAKAWILNQITSAVAAKIAEVVANAPEDLDTLKEIADWISAHANDAAAMNTQITENKNNIATNTSDISALKTSVAEKTTTKSASLSAVTTGTTKYIKLGTFHWYDSFSFKCRIAGNALEDNVNINILGGISTGSSVCGYYSTHTGLTKSIIVKRGDAWNSDFEVYLKIVQFTTAEVYVTIDKVIQDRINISESTTAPSGTLEEIAFNNLNGMFSSNIDALCIKANNIMVIPIGAPPSLEDGCIWIER